MYFITNKKQWNINHNTQIQQLHDVLTSKATSIHARSDHNAVLRALVCCYTIWLLRAPIPPHYHGSTVTHVSRHFIVQCA